MNDDAWRLRKAAALVKVLALAPGHRLHREQVMDILWPDSGRRAASNSLRKVLHAARRTLDPGVGSRYLASEAEALVLRSSGGLWVDVDAFEEAARTARGSRDPAAYRAALDLYSGELLPGDRYDGWAEEPRLRLQETHLSLLLGLARLYEERGDYESAIEALRRGVAEEPAREEAHVGLMRLYAHLGTSGEALAQFGRLESILLRELGTEPSASSRAVREEIAAGRFPLKEAPSLTPLTEQAPGTGKHNLPAARTSFVGREQEIVEMKRALAMTRLLTVTGAGGSGKTRLALEVAGDLVASYPDGVWLVELAPLSEAELVPQAVAGVLGIKEQSGQRLTDTLIEALRTKSVLLILDNCEHLVDLAAHMVDALHASCPRLRLLATSREALDVAGEVRWSVPPLSIPASEQSLSAEELEGYESTRLFVERASDRRRGFAVTTENARTVAQICRRLDGVPLAIELAAARVGALSVERINGMLEDSLGFLTGGGRTAVPRQRTLRGTLDWSYELLGERERILFRRLSAFAGGWTLNAAKAVASGEDVEQGDVLGLLSGLVDKSLVVVETSDNGGAWYRLLEPVRQYTRENLEESGETETTLGRHVEYFFTLAEESEPQWWGPEEAAWLDRLEWDHDNFRVALAWTRAQDEAETLLRLAGALSWFWAARGYASEAVQWLEEALAMGSGATTAARARALFGLGDILRRSDLERAQACLEEALVLHERLGDRERITHCLTMLALLAEFRGDATQAATLLEGGLAAARELEYSKGIPGILNALAYNTSERGDFDRAQELWEEALTLQRKRGNAAGVSGILLNRGYIELVRGDQERATTMLEESLALGQEVGETALIAGGLMCLGIAAMLRDEPKQAQLLLKESLKIDVELGSKIDLAEDLECLAEVAGMLGQLLRAARIWGMAGALREDIGVWWGPTERLLHEPRLAAARARLDEIVWETAFVEGRDMGLEQAVEYALSEEEAATPMPHVPEQPLDNKVPTLTRREEEIAALVARGMTNRQIASELMISEHTAATHLRRMLKKLGLQSRAQIGSWLAEQRPFSTDPD
jgi:predicted ATPase/DNA-binding SARP family transcriptional activator/DNA-binding CsgD family transcriptional regulator